MKRPISTRAHGMIDYAWVTTAETLPTMMAGAASTARLVRRAGRAAGLNAMVTNYESGVLRLMPMRFHLAVDLLMCATLVLSPLFLPRSERRYLAVPVLLGAAGLVAAALTDAGGAREDTGFIPSRELSEAVADPDVTRVSALHRHLE